MMCNRLVELALLPEPLNSGATAGGEEDENRGGGGGGGQDGGGGESTLYFGTGPGFGGEKEVCRLGSYPRAVVLGFVLQQTLLGAVSMSKGRVRHVTLVIAQCIPQTRQQVSSAHGRHTADTREKHMNADGQHWRNWCA